MLHAEKLEFVHPVTGEKMHFEAPLPKYFEDVLKELENPPTAASGGPPPFSKGEPPAVD